MKKIITVIVLIVIALGIGAWAGCYIDEVKETFDTVSTTTIVNQNTIDEMEAEIQALKAEIAEKDDAIYSMQNHNAYDITINHNGKAINYSADGTLFNVFSKTTVND